MLSKLLILFFVSLSFSLASGDKNREEILAILQANEELHRAFFDYNPQSVKEKAKALQRAMDGVTSSEIKAKLAFSQKKLGEIIAGQSREENNQDYHLVSLALIYLINSHYNSGPYNAYSCSMVKMKWVQNSKKVAKVSNPYAPNMPNCGTKDTNY